MEKGVKETVVHQACACNVHCTDGTTSPSIWE